MQAAKLQEPISDEIRPEYRFNFSKAKPNRFACRRKDERLVVVLDPDIAEVFKTPESVNDVLRALITTMPQIFKHKVVTRE